MSKSKIDALYSKLKGLYIDPTKNAAEIASVQSEINSITSELNKIRDTDEKSQGREYSPEEGVYRTPADRKEYEEYKKRQEKELKTPETTSSMVSDGKPVDPFEKKHLLDPITGQQYYSDMQVKRLTGQNDLAAGAGQFKSCIECNRPNIESGKPFTLAALSVDEKDASQNHFFSVSFVKKGNKIEVTYLDSNGELISDDYRAKIMQALPNAEIKYVSHESLKKDSNGDYVHRELVKISESEAKAHTEQVLRVQFDDYNCGAYATEITRMMNQAQSGEDMIRGLDIIKNMDMAAQRQKHTKDISELISKGTMQSRYAAYTGITDELANVARGIGKGVATKEPAEDNSFSKSVQKNRDSELGFSSNLH